MSGIESSTRVVDLLPDYAVKQENKSATKDLGQNEFMQLMLAQMNNQSPLEPQDNGDFIAQLAQFSSLEEMQNLTKTVDSAVAQFRSTQALQASALVGRSVLVNTDSTTLVPGGTVTGAVDLNAGTSNLRILVKNQTGELVKQIDMGQQFAGQVAFAWDGKNAQGEAMPPGRYVIQAEASYSSGSEQLPTMLGTNVDSVSIGQGGEITLNLAGLGAMPLSEVRQIN